MLKIKATRMLGCALIALAPLSLSACSDANSKTLVSSDTNSTPLASSDEQSPQPSQTAQTADVREAGSYIPYESFAAASEEYADSKVVLFFSAAWCSTCQEARENFEASLSEIPGDLAIVVVDFDDSIELRKQYGITVQHTFVQIDETGNPLAKWSGSVSIPQLLEQLS